MGLWQGFFFVHLLAAVDEALLHGRDALLLLDLFLDLGHLRRVGGACLVFRCLYDR